MLRVPTINKRKGTYIRTPKKKTTPLTKSKRIVIVAPTAPTPFTFEEEEPMSGGADIIALPSDVPVEGLNEEGELARALNASTITARQEQVAGVVDLYL